MDEKKSYKSWTISDEFWEKVKDVIPDTGTKRDPNKVCQNKPGQGRKALPARDSLEGVLYVLRTGVQWKAYGSGSSLRRYFQAWAKAGFFRKIWGMGLTEYDEIKGIGWDWRSGDGRMVKAPLAREAVGPNPTDREKMGTKRSVLADKSGIQSPCPSFWMERTGMTSSRSKPRWTEWRFSAPNRRRNIRKISR